VVNGVRNMQGLAEYLDLRVLVAEDNLINQRLVRAILQSQHIDALFVGDGAAALDEVRRGGFDLILMDISMPVMDGLTALRSIRNLEAHEDRASSLIYTVSSQNEHRDLLASRAAGANGHLAKPLVISHVLDAAAHGLQLMRARRRLDEAQVAVNPAAGAQWRAIAR
jgi:CheY-like chemotaxis protein